MADINSVEKALKIITPFKELLTAWHDEQDFLKWVPTKEDFYGRYAEVPIGIGPGGGQSYNFQVAQRQSNRGRKYEHFKIFRANNYCIMYISNEAIEASEGGDDSSFLDTFKAELEGGNVTNAQDLAGDLHGDGTGVWGEVSAINSPGASAEIVLADPETIVRVEVERQIQVVNPATTPDSLRGGVPGYLTVESVDEDAGSFTVTDSTDVTGLAVGDLLVFAGNFNAAIKGVRAYIPFTDAELTANPTLWEMLRTTNPTRQAGRRYDGTGEGLASALENGLSRAARGGMKMDDVAIWVNDRYFTAIDLELGAKAYREFNRIGNFGFDMIHVFAKGKKIPIMSDKNVPDGFAECLSRKTWVWHTLKKAPRYLTPQGSKMIVKPTDDGVEVRWGWRGNLVCRKPSDNLIVAMPSIS